MTQELKEEERQCDIREEISDSIFTNVFFSTATKTTSSLSHQRPVTITYSRPRKNILTVSDKLFGKADKHKPKVQEPVMGDEDDLSDGARTGETCSEVITDESMQCNGIETEDEKLTEETKKNIRNCLQENGGIEKVLPAEKFNRKLNLSDEKTIETVVNDKITDVKGRECLACNLNNPAIETPMKHDESVCVNNNAVIDSKKNALSSSPPSTLPVSSFNQTFSPQNSYPPKASKKGRAAIEESITTDDDAATESEPPALSKTGSKKKASLKGNSNSTTNILNSRDHNQALSGELIENEPSSKKNIAEVLINGVESNKENLIEEPSITKEDAVVLESEPPNVSKT